MRINDFTYMIGIDAFVHVNLERLQPRPMKNGGTYGWVFSDGPRMRSEETLPHGRGSLYTGVTLRHGFHTRAVTQVPSTPRQGKGGLATVRPAFHSAGETETGGAEAM